MELKELGDLIKTEVAKAEVISKSMVGISPEKCGELTYAWDACFESVAKLIAQMGDMLQTLMNRGEMQLSTLTVWTMFMLRHKSLLQSYEREATDAVWAAISKKLSESKPQPLNVN